MKTSSVKDNDGNSRYIRETSDDGRTSYLYEDCGIFGKGALVEVTDHYEDGTSQSFEGDDSPLGWLLDGGRGDRK